jgi:mannose-6-phosphate isomerase
VLGKEIGSAIGGETGGETGGEICKGTCAESWEVVDRDGEQSVIANGEFRGRTLRSVLSEHPIELMGQHRAFKAFPLLLKFLDCHQSLSVQVHPDDAAAAVLDPPDLGKTEAWVVINADPGSLIYAGLRPGVDRRGLAAAVETGTTESCLHRFEPRVGDCIFIPAGVVHALGSGLLIAEIQQCSDTTYRLFDWNRLDDQGRARELHIQRGLQAIDYEIGPVTAQIPTPTGDAHRERLVQCDKFILDRLRIGSRDSLVIESDDRVHLLAMLSGTVDVDCDPDARPLITGQSMMLPASLGRTQIVAREHVSLLDIYLP